MLREWAGWVIRIRRDWHASYPHMFAASAFSVRRVASKRKYKMRWTRGRVYAQRAVDSPEYNFQSLSQKSLRASRQDRRPHNSGVCDRSLATTTITRGLPKSTAANFQCARIITSVRSTPSRFLCPYLPPRLQQRWNAFSQHLFISAFISWERLGSRHPPVYHSGHIRKVRQWHGARY
jgi:hypothetical protein